MTETLTQLLLQLSEEDAPARLWGRRAKPYLGAKFDRLLEARILVEERPVEEWPVCSTCECDLDMRPLSTIDEKPVALCPLDHSNDEVLGEDDLRLFRLDHGAFVDAVARRTGLGSPLPSLIATGLWSLGMLQTGIETFLTLQRSVTRRPEIIDTMLRVARSRRKMLITQRLAASERGPFERADIQIVEVSECMRSEPSHIIPILDFAGINFARTEPRLIIQSGRRTIFLDGVEIKLSSRIFKLMQYLAEEAAGGRGLCERRGIEDRLWSTPVSENAVADAIRDLRQKIKPALKKGVDPAHLIQTCEPTGYMLTLAADEIRIDP